MQGTNCRRCPVLHIADSQTDRKTSRTALQFLRSFSNRFSLLCSCLVVLIVCVCVCICVCVIGRSPLIQVCSFWDNTGHELLHVFSVGLLL